MKKQKPKEDIKKMLKAQSEEYIRHTGFLMEHFDDKISAVVEQFGDIHKKLDSHTQILDSHTEMIGSMKENIEVIKDDIAIIKTDLKKKVDYDEFATLEKRVARLESKRG